MAATIPNCVSYDPTFAYELAVIVHDGMRRMYQNQEDVFYYLTVMNENYTHPAMPKGAEEGIIKGMYKFSSSKAKAKAKVQLLASGTILREVIAAAELLEKDFGIGSDVWSVTSYNELRREGIDCERWNTLHPEAKPRLSYVEQCLDDKTPVISATDYIRSYSDQIRPFVKARYKTLGTDGFGRSDTRKKLRGFFEVDRHYVAIAALKALADEGAIPASEVSKAIKLYKINPDKPNPVTV
jgi:pyruvate dehydrogenase E1 component